MDSRDILDSRCDILDSRGDSRGGILDSRDILDMVAARCSSGAAAALAATSRCGRDAVLRAGVTSPHLDLTRRLAAESFASFAASGGRAWATSATIVVTASGPHAAAAHRALAALATAAPRLETLRVFFAENECPADPPPLPAGLRALTLVGLGGDCARLRALLARAPGLRRLVLRECGMEPGDPGLDALTGLEELRVTDFNPEEARPVSLARLPPSLARLSLRGNPNEDPDEGGVWVWLGRGRAADVDVSKLPALRALEISCLNWERPIDALDTVEELTVDYLLNTDEVLGDLRRAPALRHLLVRTHVQTDGRRRPPGMPRKIERVELEWPHVPPREGWVRALRRRVPEVAVRRRVPMDVEWETERKVWANMGDWDVSWMK